MQSKGLVECSIYSANTVYKILHLFCQAEHLGQDQQPERKRKATTAQRKATASPKAKANTSGTRTGDIDFPDFVDMTVHGSTKPWEWAKDFKARLQEAGLETTCKHKRLQVFTEFTGSTCPEAAAESLASEFNFSVDFVSTADINAQCRKVIQHTRP